MAVITTSTFKPLEKYVRVRLGQGVPLVDADVNERDDIHMFEIRAYQKWYVGNGIPHGSDGFRIAPVGAGGAVNDFVISAGIPATTDALVAGRCLIDGLSVVIESDVAYSAQAIEPAAIANSVPAIVALPPLALAPGVVVTAYLDVWEHLVTPSDKPALNLPGLGVETCSRVKRAWVVRVRAGSAAPQSGDPDFIAGHAYYALATITPGAGGLIAPSSLVDVRERDLLTPPASLIPDTLGVTVDAYRRGGGRPTIDLRAAINALIRGEIPASAEIAIVPSAGFNDSISRAMFFRDNSLVAIWTREQVGANQVVASTLDLGNISAGFNPAPVAITSGASHQSVHAAPLRNGSVFVVYETVPAPLSEDINFKLWSPGAAVPPADTAVAASGARERRPFAVAVGPAAAEQVIVMWHDQAMTKWQFRRYDVNLGNFPAAQADLSPTTTTQIDLHAAKDSGGTVWAAFVAGVGAASEIRLVELPPPHTTPVELVVATPDADKNPFVLVHPATDTPWVFWVSNPAVGSAIMYSRWTPGAPGSWSAPAAIPGFPAGSYIANSPVAVADADGAIWVFWDNFLSPGGNKDIWYARLNPVSGVWTGMRPTTGTDLADQSAYAVTRGDGAIWLFWNRVLPPAPGKTDLFSRRLITTV